MKVTKAQSADNRQGILDAAARLYREHGLAGVGVADITRDAGLTHGGLYRHFESKNALVREACAQALHWSIPPLDADSPYPPGDVAGRITAYLSAKHRDDPGAGCPVAALAADAGRGDAALSEVFARGIERNISRFARLLTEDAEDPASAGSTADAPCDRAAPDSAQRVASRETATVTLATMVGALVLARATKAGQPALSDEILATARAHLLRDVEPVDERGADHGAGRTAAGPRARRGKAR